MDVLERQLSGYVSEYKEFMEISQFPAFFLQTRTASQVRAESQGYESAAITSYQVSTGQHTIFISTNLKLTKYVAFHEFTHMLDSELHVHGDKIRYIGLSAYTEYHAAQVEFAQMLGAKTIHTIQSFSMNKEILHIGYRYDKSKYWKLRPTPLLSLSSYQSNSSVYAQ